MGEVGKETAVLKQCCTGLGLRHIGSLSKAHRPAVAAEPNLLSFLIGSAG